MHAIMHHRDEDFSPNIILQGSIRGAMSRVLVERVNGVVASMSGV